MPNWCFNAINMVGEKEDMKRFVDDFEEKGFEAVLPIPSDMQSRCTDWCIKHWGTRGVNPDSIEEAEENFYFYTAWTPPSEEYLSKASEKYNIDIELLYQENLGGFEGVIVVEKGGVVYEISIDDMTNPKRLKDMLKVETYFGLLGRLEEDANNNGVEVDIQKLVEKDDWETLFSTIYSKN